MKKAPISEFEHQRLAAMASLQLLDKETDKQINAIVDYCSRHFNVPIALVTFVEEDRQLFYANKGLEQISGTSRDVSFCGHAIHESEVFEVPNAKEDIRFHDNPLVTEDPNIQFYAGKRLLFKNEPIGTICLLDRQPRKLNDDELELLELLASQVEILIRHKEQSLEYDSRMESYQKEISRLDHTRSELRKVLSAIGHDAVAPVKNVRSIVELMSDLSVDDLKGMFGQIDTALRNSESLLNDMIQWGIAHGTDSHKQEEKIDLNALLHLLHEELGENLKAKENTLLLPETSLNIESQAAPLKFILRNLILNANKFSSDGTIEVHVDENERQYCIQVKDHGVGMKEEMLNKLNMESSGFSSKGTQGEKGHGLGLNLSHQFARDIGGNLKFESELKKGTKAILSIQKY